MDDHRSNTQGDSDARPDWFQRRPAAMPSRPPASSRPDPRMRSSDRNETMEMVSRAIHRTYR